MSRCIPTINSGLSIPDLIKIAKHSFRECVFNEVQNALMQREKNMKIEIKNLRKDYHLAEMEKLKLEEKLERKCEELDTRVVEIEELRCQKLAADRTVEELKRDSVDASRALDELRSKNVESDDYRSRFESLKPRMMNLENAIANIMNVKVEDLVVLANRIERENLAKDDINLVYSSLKDDDANTDQSSPGLKCDGTPPQDNEVEEPQGSGRDSSRKMACSPSAAGDAIVICDSSDDERDLADTTYVSDTSSGQMCKRNRRDHMRGHSIKKRKRRISIGDEEDRIAASLDDVPIKHVSDTGLPQSTPPCDDSQTLLQHINVFNDSDDESSCSDAHIDNLVATMRRKTLCATQP